MLSNLKIGKRLLLIVGALLIGIASVGTIGLNNLKYNLVTDREESLKKIIETAQSLIKDYAERAQNGEFPVEEAQKRAAETINHMRYGKGDYVFIFDKDGFFLAHPKWIGQKHLEATDANNFAFMQAFVDMAKKGGGYVSYKWERDAGKPPVPKTSYISSYTPWEWTIGTGVYVDDVEAVFWQNVELIGGSAFLLVLVIGGGVLWIGHGITKPLEEITEALHKLADGHTDTKISHAENKDEVGELARAYEKFKATAIEKGRLEAIAKQELLAKEERHQKIEGYIHEFQTEAKLAVSQFAAASARMRTTAESMSATAEQTTRQSTAVAVASEQASGSVSTVASATEELSASVSEIARQTETSQKTADEAVAQAKSSGETVRELEAATAKITDVMQLISDIASQTNLLALNATIEAARAGEAGKGFAVVASEVKNLAGQTAKATDEVGAQIQTMQNATKGVVNAISNITTTINSMNKMASDISHIVQQQSSAVQEIAHNAQQASVGTEQVSSNIAGVNQAATDTGKVATHVLDTSDDLSQQAEKLRLGIDVFLEKIQAA